MRTPPTNTRFAIGQQDNRREATERRILESAVTLIGSGVAWNQLGIRQIAEQAAISRTAFYDFFASKNEVLEHLVGGLHDDLATMLTEPSSEGQTLLDLAQLRPSLDRIAEFTGRHGAIYLAFLDATADDPRLRALFDELMDTYAGLLVPAIDAARDAQPAAPQTPESPALARVLLAMTERTMLMLLRSPGDSARAHTLEALAQVWERAVYAGAEPGGVA